MRMKKKKTEKDIEHTEEVSRKFYISILYIFYRYSNTPRQPNFNNNMKTT